MIIEKFIRWGQEQPENADFMRFADEIIVGEHLSDVVKDIMYEVYQNQCCLEGIIEDMEFGYEEKSKKKQSKKSNERMEKRPTA